MGEWVKPAPIGGEQRRQREIVHDAGKAWRVGERALGIGQGVVGREQFMEAEPGQVRQPADALGRERPGQPQCPALGHVTEALAEQRGAAVRGGRCGKRHMIGVVGQTRSPNVWKWRKSWLLSLTGGLMEGYLNSSKSGVVNRSLTPP